MSIMSAKGYRAPAPVVLVEQLAAHRLVQPLHLPVVVGEYGAVNRCRIPFSTQIRSNNTSRDADIARSLPAVNRPVTPSR